MAEQPVKPEPKIRGLVEAIDEAFTVQVGVIFTEAFRSGVQTDQREWIVDRARTGLRLALQTRENLLVIAEELGSE